MLKRYRSYLGSPRRLTGKQDRALPKEKQGNPDAQSHASESGNYFSIKQRDKAQPAGIQNNESGYAARPPATRAEVAIAWFTGVLLVVGVVAAYATYLQWDAAKRALVFAEQSAKDSGRDTQAALKISDRLAKAVERQANYNRDSVELTRDSVKIANDSFRENRRGQAAVFATELEDFTVGGTPHLSIVIKNTGVHDVNNISFLGMLNIIPRNDDYGLSAILPKIRRNMTTLAGGAQFTAPISFKTPMDSELFDAIKEDKYRVYVVTTMTFSDANGSHTRNMCAFYSGPNPTIGQSCVSKADH